MTDIKIATSGLSNRIYAGHIKKNGMKWKADKTEVTGQACGAVIEHVLNNKEPVTLTVKDNQNIKSLWKKLNDRSIKNHH